MADYYGTEAGADTYHLARGNAEWAAADSDGKLAALLIASEWLDAHYSSQFPGYPTGKAEQVRQWPRTAATNIYGQAITSDAIPAQVERATYEVALRQIKSPGSLNKDWTPGQEKLSVSVSGAVAVTYAGAYTYADAQVMIGGIGAILAPVLNPDAAISSYSGRAGRV